jgi:hypothetical protein
MMTTLINLDDVPVLERQHARVGLFKSQSLLNGLEGSPDNFFLQLSHTFADFESPRHRHNFDQIRIQLKGVADFARDGVMHPGTIGYFPEGVYYGPQSIDGESSTLVLQFGGASGDGYISEARFQEGVNALKSTGTFAKGVYSCVDESGKKINQDAYEAVWESIHQTELHYRKSEYPAPVFMDPQAFEAQNDSWAQQSTGVLRKSLGVFSQRKLAIGVLLVERGSSFKLQPHSFGFVLKGEGQFQGRVFKQHATVQSDASPASLQAQSSVEIIEIHLPPRAPSP